MTGSGDAPTTDEQELEHLLTHFKSLIDEVIDPREPLFNELRDPSVIDEMESAMKITLPADYKALLRRLNGTRDPLTLTFPPDNLSLLSAEDVFDLWKELTEEQFDEYYDELTFGDKVRIVFGHPGRIPIAQNELSTEYLCLDYIPGPKGTVGQLVLNINEAEWVVVEDNTTALISRYTKALDAGIMAIERVPEKYIGEYWFTTNGQNIDYEAYRSLDL